MWVTRIMSGTALLGMTSIRNIVDRLSEAQVPKCHAVKVLCGQMGRLKSRMNLNVLCPYCEPIVVTRLFAHDCTFFLMDDLNDILDTNSHCMTLNIFSLFRYVTKNIQVPLCVTTCPETFMLTICLPPLF